MLELILLMFPTFISLLIIKKREKKDYKDILFLYPVYNVIINMISLFTLFLVKGREAVLFSSNSDSIGFAARFLLLATSVAFILPYLKEFIVKNLKFEIEIRREKGKNEKNK